MSWSPAAEWYGTVYDIAFGVAHRDFRFTNADAEDIAQEMALRVLRRTRVMAINRAWVHRGATYLCIDVTRSRESERRALERIVSDPTLRGQESRAELDPDIALAVSRLPPACQRLIHYYFREGRTWDEIDRLVYHGARRSQYATSKCVAALQRALAERRSRS